jgi:energy-coupling factor transporter ATP-binding protein EcfA2
MKIDSAILTTSVNICKNIDRFDDSDRGLLSQNILSQLRNLIEYIAEKIYAGNNDIDPNDFAKKTEALEYIKTRGNYRFLYKFHSLVQISASHYTLDEGKSERLMLNYYKYLLKIKIFLKDTYNLEILENIDQFPLNTDTKFMEYYEKIAARINQVNPSPSKSVYDDRYYIHKVKPFFVNNRIYYEVTFTAANDKSSKFDRVIAFTKLEISSNYAVKLTVRNDRIDILGKTMPIHVIDKWEISIRPCELNNFADFFGGHHKISSGSNEYYELMNFLTVSGMSLVDLVCSSDSYFTSVKAEIAKSAKSFHIYEMLEKSRDIVKRNLSGSNVIKYLLHRLNNKILKRQYWSDPCNLLSNLRLKYGCIPFDQMPFNSSLINHNPRLADLFECINYSGREHEIFARFIKNNTEINGSLFTPIKDTTGFDDIDALMSRYNGSVYRTHGGRKLETFKDHIYIREYVENSADIVNKLKELSLAGVTNYTKSVEFWLQSSSYGIDCVEKKDALRQMFENSKVALIYGSAGTGKSTLINHISNFFNDKEKIYLANTNPAIDNLRRKITASNCSFSTIAKFLSSRNCHVDCDLLIIDECSTVSNSDMKKILEKAKFKLLVLVGDVFQIESIVFGNWFSIARSFVPDKSVFELTKPYRTTKPNLLNVWNRVRALDEALLEPMVKHGYSVRLDDSIFDHTEEDQIILCLNYDGLYGINNINRFLQGNNTNASVQWGINTFKVNDPVLFNESDRFTPVIYNNLKGKIVGIKTFKDRVQFEIEIDKAINELDASGYDFELLGTSQKGNSIIRFSVNKYKNTDDDDGSSETVVPFQVAYAVSIHKAQGLEYSSVKIVITNEVEELITHNIFYTAITRAKNDLKIYWTPETEQAILSSLKLRNDKKDAALLSLKYSL